MPLPALHSGCSDATCCDPVASQNDTHPMRRAPLLVLLAIVGALTVGWLAMRPGAEAPSLSQGTDGGAGSMPREDPPALVPSSASGNDGSREALAPRAKEWTVEVSVAGDPAAAHDVTDARVRATLGDEVLEARGAAAWTSPRAGTWTLEVSLPPHPTWRRDVVVLPNHPTHTRVLLGEPHVVRGTVRDSYGDPRMHHMVAFVEGDAPVPTRPEEWLPLPHGRTDRNGQFVAELPRRGRWRAFVGFSGKVLFEDARPVEFTEAGPFEVSIVLQAPTRLLIEAHEPKGRETSLPVGVTVYRRAAILDVERPLPPQITSNEYPDPDDPNLDPDTAAELRLAIEHETRPRTAEDIAQQEHRAKVVPEGWRMDRSSVMSAQRQLLLEFLPVGEELRFAMSRGTEVFRVEGSAFLVDSPPTRVRIDLPAPAPEGAPLPPEPPSVPALVTPVQLPREPLEVGATWL